MLLRRNNKTKRKHKCWIRGIFLRRREHGQFYALFQELKFDDRTLHHTTHHVCFFFCKMAPNTYFESDWTLHNTCFKVNDSVSPILRRSSQTHVSVGSVVNGRQSRTRFICCRSLQPQGTDVSKCLRRGRDPPVIVSQTDRSCENQFLSWLGQDKVEQIRGLGVSAD